MACSGARTAAFPGGLLALRSWEHAMAFEHKDVAVMMRRKPADNHVKP
jgi:hypothetical protein